MDKKDGGPAFPETHVHPMQGMDDLMPGWRGRGGMSLRDYFAAHAPYVTEDWGNKHRAEGWTDAQLCAKWAHEYADAMLAEREK